MAEAFWRLARRHQEVHTGFVGSVSNLLDPVVFVAVFGSAAVFDNSPQIPFFTPSTRRLR
jgi:hypothetical protein